MNTKPLMNPITSDSTVSSHNMKANSFYKAFYTTCIKINSVFPYISNNSTTSPTENHDQHIVSGDQFINGTLEQNGRHYHHNDYYHHHADHYHHHAYYHHDHYQHCCPSEEQGLFSSKNYYV